MKYITEKFDQADWVALGLEADMERRIKNHQRLFKSLSYGDSDYAEVALQVGGEALDKLGLSYPDHPAVGDWALEVPGKNVDAGQITPALLATLGKVFHLSRWLEKDEPALYAKLYKPEGATRATSVLQATTKRMGITEVDAQLRRIQSGLVDDPAHAIGQSKELLETVCKSILGLHGNSKDARSKDLPELVKDVKTKLKLETKDLPGDDQRIRIYSALTQIAISTAELRNQGLGTGHGSVNGATADQSLAHLVVTSVSGVCHFLLSTFETGTP